MGTNTALGAGVHPTGTGPTLVPRAHAHSRITPSMAHLHMRLAALPPLSRGASASQTGLFGSISAHNPDYGSFRVPNPDSQFPKFIPTLNPGFQPPGPQWRFSAVCRVCKLQSTESCGA
jgi:hypothetical protein